MPLNSSEDATAKAAAPAAGKTAPGAAGRILAALRRPGVAAFLVGAAATGVLFRFAPGIDLWFQALFYRPDSQFFLKKSLFARVLDEGVLQLTPVVVGLLVVLLAAGAFRRVRAWGVDPSVVLALLLTIGLGTGAVVNGLFKEHWGRARPTQIVEFGGEKRFTPAFVISDQCRSNCSFVAGQPSSVFALFAWALMRRRRRVALAGTVVLGGVVGLGRIMQGGHFLSDVIFSGVFTFIVAWLVVQVVRAFDPRSDTAAGPP